MYTKICKNCNKEYTTDKINSKYCSTKCCGESQRKSIKLICQKCGKEFHRKAGRVAAGEYKYCSQACAGRSRNRVIKKCLNCGKEFIAHPGDIENGYSRYCSQKCMFESDEWRFKHSGELNVNWKNGASFEPYCPKFNKHFRERVRAFWNRKCAICGKAEKDQVKKLSVHHVNYDTKVCCNNNIPLFVPLCNSCHTKTNSRNKDEWAIYLSQLIYYHTNGSMKCYYSKEEMKEHLNHERQSATAN